MNLTQYATVTGLGHNTISRVERDTNKEVQPWILGRILQGLGERIREAFPKEAGDIYDYLIPPNDFGAWLRNLRLRHGLQQQELADRLDISRYSVQRYEGNQSRPAPDIQARIEKSFRVTCPSFSSDVDTQDETPF